MINFGVSKGIGLRESMEDAFRIRDLHRDKFFSAEVYDGHIDSLAARLAAKFLVPYFWTTRLKEINKPINERLEDINLLRGAYLKTDAFILKSGIISGTAAATFLIIEDRFLSANVGDVRIILGTSRGARILTEDHKPNNLKEKTRIEMLGGRIINRGVPRIQGHIALSRALGDVYFKPYITAEPRILEGRLGKENDYAIIACDGVWDTLEPQKALSIARSEGDPKKGADLIMLEAYENGSTDNITVIVLSLQEITHKLNQEEMGILRVTDFGDLI